MGEYVYQIPENRKRLPSLRKKGGCRVKFLFAAMVLLIFLQSACSSLRGGKPLIGSGDHLSPTLMQGRELFLTYCNECHPGGEAGAGPALNKPIPAWLIKFQLRQGLGAMPKFTRQDMSSEDLDKIVAYVKWLRNPR